MHYNIRLLKIFNFLIGFSLFAPLAIIYFSKVSGSYALGASIFGITMLSSAIFEVPTGIWSDMVGRRGTIILGSWARVVAFVLYAIGLSYWWLVAGAILEGISRSFYSGNNDAFLHDTLADASQVSEYHVYLGKVSASEHIGIAISAILGGIIASYSFTYVMWLSVIPQFLLALMSHLFIDPKTHSNTDTNIYVHLKDAIRLFLTNKKIRALSIADAISFSTGEVSFKFRATFFSSIWPLWAIGLLNTTLQFGASASYYFSDKLIKKMGYEKLLVIRSIVGKVSNFIAFGIPSIFSPLITIFPSFLYGAGQVAKNTLMQREFTQQQRATMSSLNSLISNIAFFLVSILLGWYSDQYGPRVALLWLTVIALPIIWIYWDIFNKKDSQ